MHTAVCQFTVTLFPPQITELPSTASPYTCPTLEESSCPSIGCQEVGEKWEQLALVKSITVVELCSFSGVNTSRLLYTFGHFPSAEMASCVHLVQFYCCFSRRGFIDDFPHWTIALLAFTFKLCKAYIKLCSNEKFGFISDSQIIPRHDSSLWLSCR